MAKIFIAVTTCHSRREYANAQRNTWASGLDNVKFFLGGGQPQNSDEVILDVDDSYLGLPAKVKATMNWARDKGYDGVLKVDDDVYVAVDRINNIGLESYDYVGNFRMRNGNYPHDYASGFSYYLSLKAVGIIADAALTEDTMEDRWVGSVLAKPDHRVITFDEKRFVCTYPQGIDEAKYLWGSNVGKTHVCFAQYPPNKFSDMHTWYQRCFNG